MGEDNLTTIHVKNTSSGHKTDLTETEEEAFKILWVIGILASFLGLALQLALLVIVKRGRKFDEIIVFQMTIARTMYTVLEYYFAYHVQYSGHKTKLCIYFFYIYFDVVSLILMFVFTKNLYNKVVVVFPLKSYNLVLVSTIVWSFSIPVGVLCPVLLFLRNNSFHVFYEVYAYIKCIVCCVNALIFIRIISVSFKSFDKQRNLKDFLKTALMAFVLVTVTSLQVLVTDLISFLFDTINSKLAVLVFSVIYSYQACIITGIFIVLIKTKLNTPIIRFFSVYFNVSLSDTTTGIH